MWVLFIHKTGSFVFEAHFVLLFVLFVYMYNHFQSYFYVKKITHNLSFSESERIRHSLRERPA